MNTKKEKEIQKTTNVFKEDYTWNHNWSILFFFFFSPQMPSSFGIYAIRCVLEKFIIQLTLTKEARVA